MQMHLLIKESLEISILAILFWAYASQKETIAVHVPVFHARMGRSSPINSSACRKIIPAPTTRFRLPSVFPCKEQEFVVG